MCGFFGTFSFDGKIKGGQSNLVSLSHRGPDSQKKYQDNFLDGEFFRLNIIGGKLADQPMVSYDKNLVMFFNGEIYNYIELAKDYNISPKIGDTRVAIELFSKLGVEIVKKFNGMFSIALYNKKYKTLNLIRDRLGTKPLYYTKKKNYLFFASEIKALPKIKNIDYNIVDNYLTLGSYPVVKSFFKNIENVPSSSIISFKRDNIKNYKYFDLKKEVRNCQSENFNEEKFEHLLKKAILIRQRSDKKINFHLSGGIDSTALLIYTKDNWSSKYDLNSSSFSYDGYKEDEYKFIYRISKKIDVINNKITLYPDEVPDLAERLQYFQDEPYGGLASVAEYKLNLEEREKGEIVSFEGMGGDEILGGYNSHSLLALNEMINNNQSTEIINKLNSYLGIGNNKERISKTKKLISSGFYANTDLSDYRNPGIFKDIDLDKTNWFKKIMFFDVMNSKIPRTLRFRDRISSACSRELRFPFLDHDFLTYSLSAPLKFKYNFGLPKYPLRKIVKKYFKDDFKLNKRSISSPQTAWLQGPLKNWAMDNLNSLETKFIINKKYIVHGKKMIQSKINNSFFIWQLINLNLFIENTKIQNYLFNDKR